jgi:hypothetical protein
MATINSGDSSYIYKERGDPGGLNHQRNKCCRRGSVDWMVGRNCLYSPCPGSNLALMTFAPCEPI